MADYAPVQETLAPAAGPPIDPDVLEQRRKLAQALIAQAMGGEPIGSWTQGIANLAQALMGGYTVRKANQQEAAGRASGASDTAAALAELTAMGGGYGGGGGETADAPGTEPVSSAPTSDVEAYIRQSASKRGIDPNVAVRVARSEGLAPGVWQSNVRNNGRRETSYGPYQLLVGGGLGDKFIRQTGLNPRDPSTVKAQIDFALDQARQGGWSPWYGAAKVGVGNWTGIGRGGGGGGETAALPNVDPVSSMPSPDVMAFIGGDRRTPKPLPNALSDAAAAPIPPAQPLPPTDVPAEVRPVGLSIGDGSVAPAPDLPMGMVEDLPIPPTPPLPRPRPNLAQALALPPASGRGTVPLPPVQPVARAPQPRPTMPLDSAPGTPAPAPTVAAAPVTTGWIAPQPRRQIFREPYPGQPLSAQEFARQGQNYLTGRGSFANQTPRVAPRTMQEPIGGGAPGAPAAAPAQPRRGLLAALLGRGGPQAPGAAQAAPAGSPVAVAGATAPGGDISSRISALLANPYVDPAIKTAVLARLMPKDRPYVNVPAGGTVFDPNTNQPLYTAPDKPEKPGDSFRPMTEEEKANYGIKPDDKRAYKINTRTNEPKPVAGDGGLSIDLTGGTEKQIFETLGESAKLARSAVTGLTGIRDARKAIEGGIISGAGANLRLPLQKIGALLGVADPKIIENTETFTAAIAPQVGAMLHAIAGTTQISNADMAFAQRAAGGDITLDEASLKRLLDIMERGGQEAIRLHNKRLDSVYPPDDEGAARSRALFTVEMPPDAAATKDAPGSSKDNPVHVGTEADYNRLPSGAFYVAPDGSIQEKP